MAQTKAEIEAELVEWYAARKAATAGKTITITTSAGSRTFTQYDLSQINEHITMLERQLKQATNAANGAKSPFGFVNFSDLDGV